MKYLSIVFLIPITIGCSTTNGDEIPSQKELQDQVNQLMSPKEIEIKTPAIDTVAMDSTAVLAN